MQIRTRNLLFFIMVLCATIFAMKIIYNHICSFANADASAAPIPFEAPVITTTFLEISMFIFFTSINNLSINLYF